MLGYCAQGGVKGDIEGYQCSTEGDLYISTSEIKPDFAKIEENCGGLDVVERSAFCRAKISFTPQIRVDLDHARVRQDSRPTSRR